MHGVKRQRPGHKDPEDVLRAKQARERSKIEEYTKLRTEFARCKANHDYSREALDLTSKILVINPEFPTGWAQRRRILLNGLFNEESQDDLETRVPAEQVQQKLLEADLALTSKTLLRNPKEYAIWEHRKWILKTMPKPDWGYEIKMVQALLERDARNYHGWDYRRYIVSSIRASSNLNLTASSSSSSGKQRASATTTIPTSTSTTSSHQPNVSLKAELAYTTNKISASFSNYSAWHYRSKCLTGLFAAGMGDTERRKMLDEEFELVKQALYTDPDDQSAWIYHRWLTRGADASLVRREIEVIQELLELEPESKWCLDSLVFYQKELIPLIEDANEKENLKKSCLEYSDKLQKVDALRVNRYKALAAQF